jgi:hypothetical protein
MRNLTILVAAVIMSGCAGVKKISKEDVDKLKNRKIAVVLKKPLQSVVQDLSSKSQVEQYQANIKRYNETLKKAFEDNWEFGEGVEFVQPSNISKYKGNTNYALLTRVAYFERRSTKYSTQRGFYWVFCINRAEEYEPIDGQRDIFKSDCYIRFPHPTGVNKTQDYSYTNYFPFHFTPFRVKNKKAETPAFTNVFGYSKSDVYLVTQMMQSHLREIHQRGVEEHTLGYLKYAQEKNCKRLNGETLVYNKDHAKKLDDDLKEGKSKEYPYYIKFMDAEELDDVVLNSDKKDDYYYVLTYPRTPTKKMRIVVSADGEVMTRGRIFTFPKASNDLKKFSDCD